ncbi:ACP S-malonyltransferase [Rubrobacter indicoceani]|uniref:ACP S-malonyltransferase n=1 Tax=Rubrobacter indicoceani TaxID=2051957 RepID=UPI000E5A50DB|nr:ACP S-malonyltransferase [Rubrobacter indicoceani]
MGDSIYRRAFVFPGQGVVGGEVAGEVRKAVEKATGGKETPYQLSVFASSMTLFYALVGAGYSPDVVAGHSLGEYAAVCAAGVVSLDDAVRLVSERDRLMNEAGAGRPGGMVALIGADAAAVEEAVSGVSGTVVAANFNTPRQLVLSGEKAALDKVTEGLKGRKVPLEVAGAFHSPLMESAAERMEKLLDATGFSEPDFPVVGATDGTLLTGAASVKDALKRQMLAPVRWVDVIGRFDALGVREIVECGEGGTLVRMLRDFKGLDFDGRKATEVLA